MGRAVTPFEMRVLAYLEHHSDLLREIVTANDRQQFNIVNIDRRLHQELERAERLEHL